MKMIEMLLHNVYTTSILLAYLLKASLFILILEIKIKAWQVTELEQSREGLLKEKQQLTEIVSSLKLEINNLKNAAGFPQSSENNKAVRYSVFCALCICGY